MHVLRGARPHTRVSYLQHIRAALCDQQAVSHMRIRGALLLEAGQLLQDARAPAELMEKQLMEGSSVHVRSGARPHALVSCLQHIRAALCDQQAVSHMRIRGALLLEAGQLLQDARRGRGAEDPRHRWWRRSRARSFLLEQLPTINISGAVRIHLCPRLRVRFGC